MDGADEADVLGGQGSDISTIDGGGYDGVLVVASTYAAAILVSGPMCRSGGPEPPRAVIARDIEVIASFYSSGS